MPLLFSGINGCDVSECFVRGSVGKERSFLLLLQKICSMRHGKFSPRVHHDGALL